jgi:hypothetical protein
MNDIRLPPGKRGVALRWMIRVSSIVISCVFLLFGFFAVTNEDKPQGAAIPLLVLVVLTIAGCFAAWRWERTGGVIIIIGALCISIAAYPAALTLGLGPLSFLFSLFYSLPFLVLGFLFWVCGKSNTRLNRKG